ncbi:MAG: prepilin-type N-terminal cleavage/methylation domain-containing protein [Candidatus Eremiobacteraeota bacterium]|nr:prepilin-type N-terminal cleavage/methylation domain-containing protein [Candidatus Eremiobacteraeota bacterium]
MGCSRGFSLIEAIISLLLVGVVLAVVAGITGEYARLSRSMGAQDVVVEALTAGSERVRCGFRQAIEVISPAAGSSAASALLTYDQAEMGPPRLAMPPLPPGASWAPYQTAWLSQVSYLADARGLIRRETASGLTTEEVVLKGVEGFSCRWQKPDRVLEFQLSVRTNGNLRTLRQTVNRVVSR